MQPKSSKQNETESESDFIISKPIEVKSLLLQTLANCTLFNHSSRTLHGHKWHGVQREAWLKASCTQSEDKLPSKSETIMPSTLETFKHQTSRRLLKQQCQAHLVVATTKTTKRSPPRRPPSTPETSQKKPEESKIKNWWNMYSNSAKRTSWRFVKHRLQKHTSHAWLTYCCQPS